jgi:hypothetical protein
MHKTGETVAVQFCVSDPATGGLVNADALPTGSLILNGVANAATVTVANVSTGVYSASVTLPTITDGDKLQLRIAATVATVAGGGIVWQGEGVTKRPADVFAALPTTPLTAQETRDAMKLAPTAGDPAAGSIDKHVDDILADTAELQTDWTDGGRLDLLLDAAAGGAGGSHAQTVTVTQSTGGAIQGATVQILDALDDSVIDTATTNSSGVAVVRCDAISVKFAAVKAGYTSSTSGATLVTGAAARPITLTAIGTVPTPTVSGTVTAYGYCQAYGCAPKAGVLVYLQQTAAGTQQIYDDAVQTLTSSATGLVSAPVWADGSLYRVRRGTDGAWSAEFAPAADVVGGTSYLLPGFLGHE